MIAMIFNSQAGQDQFVDKILAGDHGPHRVFLEIGVSHPITINNTYALEQAGWGGILVDCDATITDLVRAHRRNPFVCADATKIDWAVVLPEHGFDLPARFDYLSFDVDGAGLAALKHLTLDTDRFAVMTVEHDAYRFGDGPRSEMRRALRAYGYELLCPDVMHEGCEFEDWWIDPTLIDMGIANRFRTVGATNWHDIVRR